MSGVSASAQVKAGISNANFQSKYYLLSLANSESWTILLQMKKSDIVLTNIENAMERACNK